MVLNYFMSLGEDIRRHWAKVNFDGNALPDIAAEHLRASPPSQHLKSSDIVRWVASVDKLPPQPNLNSDFGQPPLTVYWDSRFYIEVLFWTTATTTIHQHGFAGAFAVLEGSSLQSTYLFHETKRVNAHLRLGHLELKAVDILPTGHVEPIEAGTGLIHSVFHLQNPSVTVVVRTESELDKLPQLDYLPPGVALNSHYSQPIDKRRFQLLEMVARTRPEDVADTARAMSAEADLLGVYHVLKAARGRVTSGEYSSLLRIAREAHGEDVNIIDSAVRNADDQQFIMSRRQTVTDPDLRFFLALLLNVPERDRIAELVKRSYPGVDALQRIQEWSFALSGTELGGIDFDEANRELFARMLRGDSDDAILAGLASDYGRNEVNSQKEQIIEHCSRMRETPLFRHLLTA